MDEQTLKKLADLAQLDMDAVGVYDEAVGHVDDDEIKTRFNQFRDEHAHHVMVLSEQIERLGGTAPKSRVDFTGRMAEFMTTIRSMGGTRGALHAMRSAERYHNSRYQTATTWKLGDKPLEDTLLAFYSEEQRHLAFMESGINVHAQAAR